MKGLSLPINVIVIIAIAVLVLVVVSLFFTGFLGSGISTIELQTATTKACNALKSPAYNCDAFSVDEITIDIQSSTGPKTFTLMQLCQSQGVGATQSTCAAYCGCTV